MHDEVAEFRKLCTTLALRRKTTIGLEFDMSFLAEWPTRVQNHADFTAVVSAAYLLWRERWKLDIGFLVGYRSDGAARDFDDLIYQLRTALLHADNKRANARFERWTQQACGSRDPVTADDWLSCGTALMTALNGGMLLLCQTAARGREPSFRAAWQAKMSETPETAVTKVVDDLGMRLSQWQRDGHVRQVAGRWNKYRLRTGEIAVDVLASFAEQALVSRMEALPCDYLDVLTELDVVGTGNALPALHLAHAVAEITGVSGEAYLKRLKDVWLSLRA
jgi:hypothetical protein